MSPRIRSTRIFSIQPLSSDLPRLDLESDFPRVMSLEGVVQSLQATLQDERLAPLTRIGLARMQLPLVRQASAGVAVGLGDESHPALALVAHLVSCARGADGNGVSSSALAAEISRLALVIEQGAQALYRALSMPEPEQRERMRSMRTLVRDFNVYRWAGLMLLDAARLRRRQRVSEKIQTHSKRSLRRVI